MIELFREPSMTRVGQYQCLLEAEGIRTFVRNEMLSVTEVQVPAFYPALCIMDEKDLPRAKELIQSYESDDGGDAEKEITCQVCGEKSPGNFAFCWSCSAELPNSAE